MYVNSHLILAAEETPLLKFVEQSCLTASGSLHQQELWLSFSKTGKEAKIHMTACLNGTSNMSKVIFSILILHFPLKKMVKILRLQQLIAKFFHEPRIATETDV